MANRIGDKVAVQRTGTGTWIVVREGVTEYTASSRQDAQRFATGLLSTTDQANRFTGAAAPVGEVQLITLNAYDGTDSFQVTAKNVPSASFVRGTNCTAAAIQASLRTATGDASLTVAGTTDSGPFTVTWVADKKAQPLLKQAAVSGCTVTVTRVSNGGNG